jgi:murein L,D-transpeptidase YcbB/YkuD
MLDAYERQYGPININQGARTLAEQARFYYNYRNRGGPLAARPFGGAPHIKWRKAHHALDVNSPQPVRRLAQFYRSKGVSVAFNVRGEAWHMDVLNEAELKRAAARLREGSDKVLRQGQTGSGVVSLKKLLYDKGVRNFSGAESSDRSDPFFGKYTKSAVQRFQRSNNLNPDGVVGAETWRRLRK